ncbi:hypothetical protein LWC05_00485 [Acetobacter sicerae]|uniref:Uncharacterized protein n=1 Tax=Acetobacter sicerae TaxID=85325 RepID=A0ABS8VUZ5_9PROT|nr:hypothetical protein [Acetobacter sicerae]MCE0742377.1 hypothetical protein [Acetobacter sicerae]
MRSGCPLHRKAACIGDGRTGSLQQGSGLADVGVPCQITLPKPRKACAKPDAYLWWNEYHPTRHAHALIATRMVEALQQP